jgi:hypothetical protein
LTGLVLVLMNAQTPWWLTGICSRSVKALLIILALLVGVIAGLLTGILSHLSGSPSPTAIRDGGGASQ